MKFVFFALSVFLVNGSLKAQNNKITCITYNIRYDNPSDGDNAWLNRKEKVVEVLKFHNPDIICLQEVLSNQMQYLQNELSNYGSVGVGRDDGKEKGEYSPVFYLKAKFELLNWKTIWLSPEPEYAGSKGWDAALPRVATFVLLSHKKTKKRLLVVSTHYDHIGKLARKESSLLIQSTIKQLENIWKLNTTEPFEILLGGDLNTEPNDDPLSILESDGQLFNFKNYRPTFRDFSVKSTGKIIDYLMHSKSLSPISISVDTSSQNGFYPSDHNALVGKWMW